MVFALPMALSATLVLAQTALAQTSVTQARRLSLVCFFKGASGHGGLLGGGAGRSAAAAGSQGYLGIGFRDVADDRVALLKLKEAKGAEVIQVDHDGPAGLAGLTEHDVILQVNGQAIEGEEQLRRVLREIPVGHIITIVFSRFGDQQTISAQMADRVALERQAWEQHLSVPEPAHSSSFHGNSFMGGAPSTAPITAPPDPHGHSLIGSMMLGSSYTGVVLEMIGPQLAQFFGSQGGNGLLVRSVDPNSPAATAGMRAGDVVVRANAVIITGTGEWYKLVRENKGKPVAVVVVREKQEQTLVLVPDSKKRSSLEHSGPLEGYPGSQQAQAAMHNGLADLN